MTAPSVVLQLAPLDRLALTMEHVAKQPKLIRRVGDKGAAIVAYVCRELAANVAEHGQSNGPGRMELYDGFRSGFDSQARSLIALTARVGPAASRVAGNSSRGALPGGLTVTATAKTSRHWSFPNHIGMGEP